MSLFPLTHGSVRFGVEKGKGEAAAWICKLPAALRRKMLLEPRAAIWLVLAIWVQRLQGCRRHCQERRDQPQHAKCGLLNTGQISSGHREATARGLGMSFCEPVSHRVTRQQPWPHWLRKLIASPYPGLVPAIPLECGRVSGWSSWDPPVPSRNVNIGQEMSLKQPRVPQLKPSGGCVGDSPPHHPHQTGSA